MTLSFANPSSVHTPLGLYSHTVSVPEGTELLFISGQLGVRPDGTTPPTMAEQADQVFSNIVAVLRAHELGPTDIVKLTVYVLSTADYKARAREIGGVYREYFGRQYPAMNFLEVKGLYDADRGCAIEIEAVAVLD